LVQEHIPVVAKKLVEMAKDLSTSEMFEFFNSWIPVVVHFYGINLRWLGKIRDSIPDSGDREVHLNSVLFLPLLLQ